MISQTSGHGDFRMIYEHGHTGCGCEMAHVEEIGASRIVDGPDAVTAATRENLRQGASQIKLMTGGGAASLYDPLDVTEFFEEEIRAAVRAAEDWGTYVMVHVYNPRGIARAIKAGVRSIEHGHLIDEPTMKLLADSGAWLSMQAFTVEDNTYPSPVQQAKHLQICNGTDRAYELAKKYNVKLAWGTDLLFNPAHTKNQNHGIVKLQKWFSNFEILKMVTSDNARLLAMSGARNPYPGKLGVVEEGALADLLLVEGNPLQNVDLLGDPGTTSASSSKTASSIKTNYKTARHPATVKTRYMIRQPVLYAILLVFPLFGASAQEPGLPVSFEQAVEMVNRDNKSIRIAEQGLDWAKSERQRLNSFWYPRISASGAYVHMANDIEVKESLSAFTDPVKDFIHSIDPGEQIITSLLNNLGSHSFSVPLAPRNVSTIDATVALPIFTGGKRIYCRQNREIHGRRSRGEPEASKRRSTSTAGRNLFRRAAGTKNRRSPPADLRRPRTAFPKCPEARGHRYADQNRTPAFPGKQG